MKSSTFSPKPSAWFTTKVFSLLSLIFISAFLVGCGSSSSGSTQGSDKDITAFSFDDGVIKNATIGENDIDITIYHNSTDLTPNVTHTGVSYTPSSVDINFTSLPNIYTVTAEDGTDKNYSVIVRRAFIVSNETELVNAIDTINATADDRSYITILITDNITLSENITIPSDWEGNNIILENNSTASNVSITGLTIEGVGTVTLINVNAGLIVLHSPIAAGIRHSLAIDENGTLWATGWNLHGQLGLGNTDNQTSFQSVTFNASSPVKIVSVAASDFHSLALDSEGRVWATGNNEVGQLGLGNTNNQTSFQSVEISGLSPNATIVAIAAGDYHEFHIIGGQSVHYYGGGHSLALDSEGKLWVAGHNDNGQLGLNNTSNQTSFQSVTISGNATIVSISAGSRHSLAVTSDGKLWATGLNDNGQLGLGNTDNQTSFQSVTFNTSSPVKIVSIAAGWHHSLALDSDGRVWATGGSGVCQLGLGYSLCDAQDSFTPIATNTTYPVKFKSIAAGVGQSLAVDDDGKLWVAGYNDDGQLGLDNYEMPVVHYQETNTSLISGAKFKFISAGNYYSLAVTTNGTLLATGNNLYGQLGFGDNINRNRFTPVSF
jgi:alpha-tubulin suppressor-like RCC1 family protein